MGEGEGRKTRCELNVGRDAEREGSQEERTMVNGRMRQIERAKMKTLRFSERVLRRKEVESMGREMMVVGEGSGERQSQVGVGCAEFWLREGSERTSP